VVPSRFVVASPVSRVRRRSRTSGVHALFTTRSSSIVRVDRSDTERDHARDGRAPRDARVAANERPRDRSTTSRAVGTRAWHE